MCRAGYPKSDLQASGSLMNATKVPLTLSLLLLACLPGVLSNAYFPSILFFWERISFLSLSR